jgi:hypothetical protein
MSNALTRGLAFVQVELFLQIVGCVLGAKQYGWRSLERPPASGARSDTRRRSNVLDEANCTR